MKSSTRLWGAAVFLCVAWVGGGISSAQDHRDQQIPQLLQPWKDWVTWTDRHLDCPKRYDNAEQQICFWPSRLTLSAEPDRGKFRIGVAVFSESWIPLPGSADIWPVDVRVEGEPVAVVEHDGRPAVRLPTGTHEITGHFSWRTMPQRIAVPPQIGVLSLSVSGLEVPLPNWDERGDVWLKRIRAEESDEDLLLKQVYRILEDGIPMWLRTEMELTVSGRSREEPIGWILPAGWRLSVIDSPIPVAVDKQGRMKAQVRAGKWTIRADAFRTNDVGTFQYANGAQPATNVELIGFRAQPEFRMAEVEGIRPIDVKQTTFPAKWRELPVFQWQTDSAFQIVEKVRGMGLRRPEGLSVDRRLWLDEDGGGLTYRDTIRGRMQQIWRLDVAEGQQLGTARVDGEPQLITANPQSEASGIEIRRRNLMMDAIGRIERTWGITATGWRTDADSVRMTLVLPPGWRVFALFGADYVEGDWLTAWSLLDLFLLLIFSLAVFRLWGFWAGVTAFLAFGLSYHEPGSPRLTWLFLLMPLALLRVVPAGTARRWITAWKFLALALLVLWLVPFVARQVQTAIYPQLERPGVTYAPREFFRPARRGYREPSVRALPQAVLAPTGDELPSSSGSRVQAMGKRIIQRAVPNLAYDPQAMIQTGPAEPEWNWNQVHCFWNNPVKASERIYPILISLPMHRVLTAARLAFLVFLVGILLSVRARWTPFSKGKASTAAVLCLALLQTHPARADIPDREMLQTLRKRLLETSDAFPTAADIPLVELQVNEGRILMNVEVHAAINVAVPLPGRLPAWSPVSVTMDDQAATLLCRRDGYLWLVVPQGVHRVNVEGLLPDAIEWSWTFLLKPRRVVVEAEGWTVTGVGRNGVPEQQVFLARQRESAPGEATYDRKDFQPVLVVDRYLEIGLVWQLRNEVTRLSPAGKAVALSVPLLAGENVLTPNIAVEDDTVQVRMAEGQERFSWNSELPLGQDIRLIAASNEFWVERWHLVTSPVWNSSLTGLEPVFESEEQNLIPVWHPWPGEQAQLAFSKPQVVSGDTMTVQHVQHEVSLGDRRRTTQLKIDVNCSLGADFLIDFDAGAKISSLKRDGQLLEARRDGDSLVVPVRPGQQQIEVAWTTDQPLRTVVRAESVKLPVEAANVTTVMNVPNVPESRWILWAHGPLRGPAVRFWTIVVCSVLAAIVLGSLPASPLRRREWVLLALGLTQVHVSAALLVIVWLFALSWRGRQDPQQMGAWRFDFLQFGLVLVTFVVLGILIVVVGEGLLGNPEMFIVGNQSYRTHLQWFEPRAGQVLPQPYVVSISVWFYRLLMLLWALWLATALLRWLKWGWTQFSHGGGWRRLWRKRKVVTPSAENPESA